MSQTEQNLRDAVDEARARFKQVAALGQITDRAAADLAHAERVLADFRAELQAAAAARLRPAVAKVTETGPADVAH